MDTKRGSKIRIALLVVVMAAAVAMVAVGAMAATGMFESDKTGAFKLLAQVPDRLACSYVNDYLEAEKLQKACKEKGTSANIRVSGLKMNEELQESLAGGMDLSSFSLQVDSQAEASGKKAGTMLGISKGDEKVTAVVYMDEEKQCIALPELAKGKYLRMDKETEEEEDVGAADYISDRKYEEFGRELGNFLSDEMKKVYDDITCEKKEKGSYELTIPRDTLNRVVSDFYEFMKEQKDTIELFDLYTQLDVLSSLKEFTDYFTANSADFIFYVTGSGDTLSQIRAESQMGGVPVSFVADFVDGEDAKTEITVKAEQEGEEAGLSLVLRDKKADVCQESLEMNVLLNGVSFGAFDYETRIDTKSNEYRAELNCKVEEEELVHLAMQGKIKNLNPGRSLSYALDRVSLNMFGEELFTAAMDVTAGTLEGTIEPPKGEEYVLADDMSNEDQEKLDAFISEAGDNAVELMVKWGLMSPSDVLMDIGALESNTPQQSYGA